MRIDRRHPKIDTAAFNDVASFLADNAGNITSVKGVADSMRQTKRGISPTTVGEYIAAMRENYLLFRANRYDIKGKAYLQAMEKYYLGDPGFRFWFLGKTSGDLGHRIENVVYLNCCDAIEPCISARSVPRKSTFIHRIPRATTTIRCHSP